MEKKKKIFIGLSGGVDSSVAAALLRDAGHDVTGVFIQVWQPDFLPCTQDSDRKDAKRVAAALQIPFEIIDLSKEYKKDIVDTMIAGYEKGNTPNPDVLCNRYIKFGAFWEWAQKRGADAIATGHYARVLEDKNGMRQLARGVDPTKDQSYFLWMLTETDLSHILFPIGSFKKSAVRSLAAKYQLPTADKKDSQGLCFMGAVDIQHFLKQFLQFTEGNVLDTTGAVIGKHNGAGLYTIGQRHGFFTTQKTTHPEYVIQKNIHNNTITVSESPAATSKKSIPIHRMNWIGGSPILGKKYTAHTRYHGEKRNCTVACSDEVVQIIFDAREPVAAGQSIVLYDGSVCIGGGIVE